MEMRQQQPKSILYFSVKLWSILSTTRSSTAPRQRKIRLRVISRQPGGQAIEVLDAGPGIDAQHHARIFDRFYAWMKAARASAAVAVSA